MLVQKPLTTSMTDAEVLVDGVARRKVPLMVGHTFEDNPAVWKLHDDVTYLRLDFEQAQTPAFMHVSWLHPSKVRRVTVVGETMLAVYDDLSDNERVRVCDTGVDAAATDEVAADAGHDGLAGAGPVGVRNGRRFASFPQVAL